MGLISQEAVSKLNILAQFLFFKLRGFDNL